MLKKSSERSSCCWVFTIDDSATVCFPYLDAVRGIVVGNQGFFQALEDVNSNIFRGGVSGLELGMFVQVTMVEGIDYFLYCIFGDPEVNGHAQRIKLGGPDSDFDLPVMTMGSFTIAGVFPQVVASGKVRFNENIKHFFLLIDVSGAGLDKPGRQIFFRYIKLEK